MRKRPEEWFTWLFVMTNNSINSITNNMLHTLAYHWKCLHSRPCWPGILLPSLLPCSTIALWCCGANEHHPIRAVWVPWQVLMVRRVLLFFSNLFLHLQSVGPSGMGKITLVIFSNTSSDLEGVFGFLLEVGGKETCIPSHSTKKWAPYGTRQQQPIFVRSSHPTNVNQVSFFVLGALVIGCKVNWPFAQVSRIFPRLFLRNVDIYTPDGMRLGPRGWERRKGAWMISAICSNHWDVEMALENDASYLLVTIPWKSWNHICIVLSRMV